MGDVFVGATHFRSRYNHLNLKLAIAR
jgi:hypothetical protein